MTFETENGTAQHFQRRKEERQFRSIYAVVFTISLISAVFTRLMARRRTEQAGEKHESIIEEARARTYGIVPFFFMG